LHIFEILGLVSSSSSSSWQPPHVTAMVDVVVNFLFLDMLIGEWWVCVLYGYTIHWFDGACFFNWHLHIVSIIQTFSTGFFDSEFPGLPK
jgi:hypothetical protein